MAPPNMRPKAAAAVPIDPELLRKPEDAPQLEALREDLTRALKKVGASVPAERVSEVVLACLALKVAELEAEYAALLQRNQEYADEVCILREQLAAAKPKTLLASLGLSTKKARQAQLQPIITIVSDPAVESALSAPAATRDDVRSAVTAISGHLQAHPEQLDAFLAMFGDDVKINGDTVLAGCTAANPAIRRERLVNAAALCLVALRIKDVRSLLSFVLVPRHTEPATASWGELNKRLYAVDTWEHEGHAKGDAIRDVYWFALGDGVADEKLFTKIERVAAALFVGLLARDDLLVVGK